MALGSVVAMLLKERYTFGMTFDPAVFSRPATKEDLADVVIQAHIAITQLSLLLTKVANREQLEAEDFAELTKTGEALAAKFNELTGYQP